MLLNPILAKRIDSKLASIQKQRPLSRAALLKLKEQFAIELTYNSNAIEGNRLTLKETYWVIAEGITVKGKPLKDHLEATDHYEAIQFLYKWVGQKRTHRLTEHVIRSLHQLVVQKSDALSAGSYRSGNVLITGSSHVPVAAQEVPPLMNGFLNSIKAKARKMHTVELAAFAHHQLVFIHPFADGNGRTARLLMNLILLQRGYPLVVILKNDRRKYYETLHQADKGRLEPLVRFIGQSVERSLNLYLKVLAPEAGKGNSLAEQYRPLREIVKGTRYSAKYLNLLIRLGKLEAHKEGRAWVTSKAAVERYLLERKRIRN